MKPDFDEVEEKERIARLAESHPIRVQEIKDELFNDSPAKRAHEASCTGARFCSMEVMYALIEGKATLEQQEQAAIIIRDSVQETIELKRLLSVLHGMVHEDDLEEDNDTHSTTLN